MSLTTKKQAEDLGEFALRLLMRATDWSGVPDPTAGALAMRAEELGIGYATRKAFVIGRREP